MSGLCKDPPLLLQLGKPQGHPIIQGLTMVEMLSCHSHTKRSWWQWQFAQAASSS